MGGGGTTVVSGGGGSGRVDYPEYMKTKHSEWLDEIDSYINASNNPYTSKSAYDPSAYIESILNCLYAMSNIIAEMCTDYIDIDALSGAVNAYDTYVDGINVGVDWDTYYDVIAAALSSAPTYSTITPTSITLSSEPSIGSVTPSEVTFDTTVVSTTEIEDTVDAVGDAIEDAIDTYQIPKFEAGMRDVNAVVSSAFAMGEAYIYARLSKELTQMGKEMLLRAHEINASWNAKKNELTLQQKTSVNEFNVRQKIRENELKHDWTMGYDKLAVTQQNAIDTLKTQQEIKKNELSYGYTNDSNKLKVVGASEMLNTRLKIAGLYKEHADLVKSVYLQAVDFKMKLTSLCVDSYRLCIVARKEEADENLRIDVADVKWTADKYQIGSNMMASIHGTAVSPEAHSKQNAVSSVLGGALSGAAMGLMGAAMMGPAAPIGLMVGAGAVIGGLAGLF